MAAFARTLAAGLAVVLAGAAAGVCPGIPARLAVRTCSAAAAGHPLETVPPGHWAYQALALLAAAGLIAPRDLARQPLTRSEIAALVRQAERAASADGADASGPSGWRPDVGSGAGRGVVPRGVADLLRALRWEFAPEPSAEGGGGRSADAPGAGGPAGESGTGGSVGAPGPSQPASGIHPGLSAAAEGGAVQGLGLTAFPRGGRARSVLGWGAGGEGWLLQAEAVWDGRTVEPGRVSARGRFRGFDLQAGSERLRWGASPRSTLFLSEHAGPIEGLLLTADARGVRLTKFAAPLLVDPPRYLVGTRADWQVNPRLRVGLVELVVARPGGLLPYWLLNPLPAVLSGPFGALLQEWTGANDNPLGGLEVDYRPRPGLLLYGQGLVDDISTRGNAPHRIGWQAGALAADPFRTGRTSLRVEYTAVTNWTYTSMSDPTLHFQRDGRPSAFWAGNDADDLYLEVEHVLSAETSVRGWLSRTRHGAGRIGAPWPSESEAFASWWLSGVVETRHAAGAAYERRWGGGWWRLWAEAGRVANVDNLSGRDGTDFRAGVRFSTRW